jgi:PAS domain S-box-containing protein
MKTTNLNQIVSFSKSILETGVEENDNRDTRKSIIRLNLFLTFGLISCVINFYLNFIYTLNISAAVNLSGIFLLAIAFFLNRDGYYHVSKILAIVTIHLYLLSINYVNGFRSGVFLLIFPHLLAMVFVVNINIKNNLYELLGIILCTLFTTIGIFSFSPMQSTVQIIDEGIYNGIFSINLIISLLLTFFYAFLILRTLEKHDAVIVQEKQFSDTIYDTSLDAVIIVTINNLQIIDCNKTTLEIFGYKTKSDLIKKLVPDILGKSMQEIIGSIHKSGYSVGSPWYGNMELKKSDEDEFYAYVNIVPFAHNNIYYAKISILDISEIKIAEFETIKAKEKAEKATQVKSRFLSNMSHELRTPLNAIIGTTNILNQEDCLPAQQEYLTVLKHSSEHILELINDILDISKIEAGKMELESIEFNFQNFIQKVIAPFQATLSPQLTLISKIDPELQMVIIGDETRLQQVLNNLLSNAKKFTSSGSITLTTKLFNRTEKNVSIYFEVTDTGIGIKPSKMKQIFESFTQANTETTRKYGGTGLGLSISTSLVQKMGGQLVAESEFGKGSTFKFTLTFGIGNSNLAVDTPILYLKSLEGYKVMIAEDNSINMMVANKFLTKWNLEVDQAVNGIEALQLYHKNHYDLLLIDLEMPEMDGKEAVRRIRQTNTQIPIIAFTAAVYANMEEDLHQRGFSGFVSKPFKPEQLHSKIESLLKALV